MATAMLTAKLIRAGLYQVGDYSVEKRAGMWEVLSGGEVAGGFKSWTEATGAAREWMGPPKPTPLAWMGIDPKVRACARKAVLERAMKRAGAVETMREKLLRRVERLAEVLVRYDEMTLTSEVA